MAETAAYWKARLECPQCGADVEQEAGDQVFTCSYCKTSLYMTSPTPLRYILTTEATEKQGFIFLPFWRFVGMRYLIRRERQIDTSHVDTTVSSIKLSNSLLSLGIAPQVHKFRMVTKSQNLFEAEISAKDSIKLGIKRIHDLIEETPYLTEYLITERKYLLYAPFILKDRVLSMPVGGGHRWEITDDERDKLLQKPANIQPRLTFIPLLCPECGHPLPPHKGALGFLCSHCTRLWFIPNENGFAVRPYRVVEPNTPAKKVIYLPFWLFQVSLSGIPVKTRADLLKIALSYQSPPSTWQDQPVQIFIPAFKLNPKLFINLSKQTTLSINMTEAYRETTQKGLPAEPIKIAPKEAAQALKVVLAEILTGNQKVYNLITTTKIRITTNTLTFFPYTTSGSEYVNLCTGKTLPFTAIALGRQS